MYSHELIEHWRQCSLERPPFFLPNDGILMTDDSVERGHSKSFDDFVKNDDFDPAFDHRLHLGLIPIPYAGNIRNASVFILMLNPGLSPTDYYGEQRVTKYRDALIRNLYQQNGQDDYPFLFLNPCFSWHGGFRYWHDKFREIASTLARQNDLQYQSALSKLAKSISVLELFPYHSRSFNIPDKILRTLASTNLAIQFVHKVLVPRAQAREAVIVVARRAKDWNLPEHKNIIVYKGGETRSAHLTLTSPGGKAIAKQLGIRT